MEKKFDVALAMKNFESTLMVRQQDFETMLPAHCPFDRYIRIIKTALLKSPTLLQADPITLFQACLEAAKDGLFPDGREAALVSFNQKDKDTGGYKLSVQYMPMVAGILKKIRNSGELISLSANVVYEKDTFDYTLGDDEHISHKPCLGERGKELCVYAIVKTKDGGIYREVMTKSDVDRIRNLSKAKNSMPWTDHWGEMAKKTVIRRLAKRLPMSSDLETVITRDDALYEFDTQARKIINPTIDKLNNQIKSQGISHQQENSTDFQINDNITQQANEYFENPKEG